MEIKIKYFNEDYPRLEKLSIGNWVDLRVDSVEKIYNVKNGVQSNSLVASNYLKNTLTFKQGQVIKFGLGVAMELPKGYEAEIRPRSSTFKHWGLMLTNGTGTIDNSYNGDNDEWMAEFIATRDGAIERFDRVCQFRIHEIQPDFDLVEVDHLGNDDRGGYGTTGK